MRLIDLTLYDPLRKTILFLNGGGQIPYSKHSKLVKYFQSFEFNLIAVELPGHGESIFPVTVSQHQFVEQFIEEFTKIIIERDLSVHALIGFSLGGLFSLKYLEISKISIPYAIVYGCGFEIGLSERSTFNYYTSEAFFHDMNWEPIMRKNHGRGWVTLLNSMDNLMTVDSLIFSDPNLIDDNSEVLIIFGANEELFDSKHNENLLTESGSSNFSTIVLPETSHFEYTSKSWDQFKNMLEEFEQINRWFQ